jgi:hypothetical protein
VLGALVATALIDASGGQTNMEIQNTFCGCECGSCKSAALRRDQASAQIKALQDQEVKQMKSQAVGLEAAVRRQHEEVVKRLVDEWFKQGTEARKLQIKDTEQFLTGVNWEPRPSPFGEFMAAAAKAKSPSIDFVQFLETAIMDQIKAERTGDAQAITEHLRRLIELGIQFINSPAYTRIKSESTAKAAEVPHNHRPL